MARQNMSTTFQTSAKAKKFLDIRVGVQAFLRAADVREREAAKIATDESRKVFDSHLSGRPLAPPRPGRPTSAGQFATFIHWIPAGATDVSISLDVQNLMGADRIKYVWVNEIGTGQTASILNPPGTLSVKSQRGRRIPGFLAWANGPGGEATSPHTGDRSQQLYVRGDLNGGFVVKGHTGRIRREIKGKHFIREGGALGFRTLDLGLRADVKRIFQ